MKKIIMIAIIITIIASGCSDNNASTEPAQTQTGEITDTTDTETNARTICLALCQERLERDMDISSGPCLTDPLVIEEEWVCDIVHEPRQAIDNLEENQCKSYIEGKAKHFIEMDQQCEIVRIE